MIGSNPRWILPTCGDKLGEVDSLLTLAHLLPRDQQNEMNKQALALSRSLGNKWREAQALDDLGWGYGNYERAHAYCQKRSF